ncbi:MAG TPA: CAP domain-containing protein [Patescibacteria group bacterium]|nr:CAP domain-containing protein [Patescibacteria group bacterium]
MTIKKSTTKSNFCYGFITSLLLVGIFLCPTPTRASDITPEKIIQLTNQKREQKDLSRLTANQYLAQAAYQKAEFLLQNQLFDHNTAKKRFSDWVKETPYQYSYVGENLAIDFTESKDIIRAWMNSANHKKNLLYPKYKEIGVAVLQGRYQDHDSTLVVQIFGTPLKTAASQETSLPADTNSSIQTEQKDEKNPEMISGPTNSDKNKIPLLSAKNDPIPAVKALLGAAAIAMILTYLYALTLTKLSEKNHTRVRS